MEKYRGGVFYKNNDRAVWEQTSLKQLEATDFIREIRIQTDKLDFLFQALVKTSRWKRAWSSWIRNRAASLIPWRRP